MNLTDHAGFSDSLVLPQQIKTSSGVISPMGEKEWGECRLRTAVGMLQWEKDFNFIFSRRLSIHFGSVSFLWRSIFPTSPKPDLTQKVPIGPSTLVWQTFVQKKTQPSALTCHCPARLWITYEVTAVYWKHLVVELVVAGDVKRSAGGSTTTS